MRIAGIVLDLYDDPKGVLLRNKIASSGEGLPTKLASMHVLSVEELDRLPDRLFALVATNGDEVVRKYAMHDPEHLALSMIYFDEAGHLFPVEVQKKVACNLINGCAWYGIDPPESLVKTAMIGGALSALTAGMGVMDMASKARQGAQQGRERMDAFRQAQASGTKTAAGRQIELTMEQDAAMQQGKGPEGGHIWDPLDDFSDHDATHRKLDAQLAKIDQPEPSTGGYPGGSRPKHTVGVGGEAKKADLVGTEAMPQSTLRSGSGRPSPTSRLSLPSKTAAGKVAAASVALGWVHCGDLSAVEPPVKTKTASYQHFALPHLQRYPIDNSALLEKAASYFNEHLGAFPLAERRVFAQCVAQRAAELGMKVAGAVLDYAGDQYGPNLVPELHARISQFEGTGHEIVYEVLLEKRAEIDPMIMAEMLREADEETGAARAYGRPGVGLLDPFAVVYGGQKLAAKPEPKEEDTYSWSEGGDYVSGFQLMALSKQGLKLNELFGDGFADSFQKDPIGIFKSMPSPQKVVLSRLAGDSNAGTFRV
jgi:hypothetical protein